MIKTFVLDTNVMVHNPQSIFSFEDNHVVLPLVVIEELDNLKKFQDERGRNSRQILRLLDQLRDKGNVVEGVETPGGGTLRVELESDATLPKGLAQDKIDNTILMTALMLKNRGDEQVRLISKDVNVRVKADALGLAAEDYENSKINLDELYPGWFELKVPGADIDAFYENKVMDCPADLPAELRHPNACLLMRNIDQANQSALGRLDANLKVTPLRHGESDAWGVRALNVEQKFAMDLLLDDSIHLVTLVGAAGTGKTLLALAAGMQRTVEDKKYSRMLVSRPVIPLGKDIGYLPGTKEEKLKHWMQPIFDNLEYLTGESDDEDGSNDQIQYLIDTNKLEMEAVTYIRGRSIPRQFVIVDEAQNLTPHEVKTVVSRAGEGTKIILTGDPAQIDNPYLDSESNGLTYLVEKFKGQKIFGHVTLRKTERSDLAGLATEIL